MWWLHVHVCASQRVLLRSGPKASLKNFKRGPCSHINKFRASRPRVQVSMPRSLWCCHIRSLKTAILHVKIGTVSLLLVNYQGALPTLDSSIGKPPSEFFLPPPSEFNSDLWSLFSWEIVKRFKKEGWDGNHPVFLLPWWSNLKRSSSI